MDLKKILTASFLAAAMSTSAFAGGMDAVEMERDVNDPFIAPAGSSMGPGVAVAAVLGTAAVVALAGALGDDNSSSSTGGTGEED